MAGRSRQSVEQTESRNEESDGQTTHQKERENTSETEDSSTLDRYTGVSGVSGRSIQRSASGAIGAESEQATDSTASTVSYDPGPDHRALSERYGLSFLRNGQAAKVQRLEDDFGSERVSGWVSEGMTVETMGKPQNMEAFRERQASRSEEIPADIERHNQASLQRSTAATREDGHAGQTQVPDSVRDVLSSPGRSLDESVQREMNSKMGENFSDVQIHAGPKAAEAADSINARAFTVGNHVAFNRGEYQPDTESGKEVLAHELTHVRQQTQGAVSLLPKTEGMVVDPDPRLEREAEQVARQVVDGESASVDESGGGADGVTVNRFGTELHVQRLPTGAIQRTGSAASQTPGQQRGGADRPESPNESRRTLGNAEMAKNVAVTLKEEATKYAKRAAQAASADEAQRYANQAAEAAQRAQDRADDARASDPDAENSAVVEAAERASKKAQEAKNEAYEIADIKEEYEDKLYRQWNDVTASRKYFLSSIKEPARNQESPSVNEVKEYFKKFQDDVTQAETTAEVLSNKIQNLSIRDDSLEKEIRKARETFTHAKARVKSEYKKVDELSKESLNVAKAIKEKQDSRLKYNVKWLKIAEDKRIVKHTWNQFKKTFASQEKRKKIDDKISAIDAEIKDIRKVRNEKSKTIRDQKNAAKALGGEWEKTAIEFQRQFNSVIDAQTVLQRRLQEFTNDETGSSNGEVKSSTFEIKIGAGGGALAGGGIVALKGMGGIKVRGTWTRDDDQKFRVSWNVSGYGRFDTVCKSVASANIEGEVGGTYTRTFAHEQQWVEYMCHKQLPEIEERAFKLIRENGTEEEKAFLEEIKGKREVAEQPHGQTKTGHVKVGGQVGAVGGISGGLSGELESGWAEKVEKGKVTQKAKNFIFKAKGEFNAKVLGSKLQVGLNYIKNSPTPENDGLEAHITVGGKFVGQLVKAVVKRVFMDKGAGHYRDRLKKLYDEVKKGVTTVKDAINSAYNILDGLAEEIGGAVKNELEGVPTQVEGGITASGESGDALMQFNFAYESAGWVLENRREIETSGSGIEMDVMIDSLQGGGGGIEFGAKHMKTRIIAEEIGDNTLEYVRNVFNGLRRREEVEKKLKYNTEAYKKWNVFAESHRRELISLFKNIGEGRGPHKDAISIFAQEPENDEERERWEAAKNQYEQTFKPACEKIGEEDDPGWETLRNQFSEFLEKVKAYTDETSKRNWVNKAPSQ